MWVFRLKTHFIILTLGIFVGCSSINSDLMSEKRKMGKRYCRSIIYSLESFKANNGAYPISLTEISEEERQQLPLRFDNHDVYYKKIDDQNYKLGFTYAAAGLYECIYNNTTTKWNCGREAY